MKKDTLLEQQFMFAKPINLLRIDEPFLKGNFKINTQEEGVIRQGSLSDEQWAKIKERIFPNSNSCTVRISTLVLNSK